MHASMTSERRARSWSEPVNYRKERERLDARAIQGNFYSSAVFAFVSRTDFHDTGAAA